MATRKPKENDASLPFAALQLLAPPVRMVSAALWKVMKQRDVMRYGVVEEFVTSACETVPGLLTLRHQGKLALGLRGRYILELCSTHPDEKVILPHLERVRAPAAPSPSSAPTAKRDVKIMRTVESFQSLVHTLLTDPAEREHFFSDEFPVDYGPEFDQEMEKLLWEFLIRLDQLLPVPNLAQTVSWLSDTPPVLEECARAATQPQLLKILLQHQTCLGHLETAASLPPNMGDSILDSLSLPPSGRVPSNQTRGAALDQPTDKTPFITPVFGLISNEDVPLMISANKRTLTGDELATNKPMKFTVVKQRQNPTDDGGEEGGEEAEEERNTSKRSSGFKRKQPDQRESESVEEEEVLVTRSGRKRMSGSRVGKGKGKQKTNTSEEDGAKTQDLDVKTLYLPEDPSLCSVYASCMSSQPRVVIEKLKSTPTREGKPEPTQRRKSPAKAPTRKCTSSQPGKSDSDRPGLDDKENHPVLPSISSSPPQQRSNTETLALPGDADDYVADSEDEATKNFKGRGAPKSTQTESFVTGALRANIDIFSGLSPNKTPTGFKKCLDCGFHVHSKCNRLCLPQLFMKRYYKTKHGTYVPTLREYWKPGMTQRHLSAAPGKRR
uniref:TERF1-interacting nuclear factor 2 n=1 Tax=Semicossyphus pulcher TaxID=241346 RepID=UPI0037E8B378